MNVIEQMKPFQLEFNLNTFHFQETSKEGASVEPLSKKELIEKYKHHFTEEQIKQLRQILIT